MNRPDINCPELTEKTAAVLNDNLQLLFVSTQQNNLRLCIRYAVEQSVGLLVMMDYSGFNV